MGSLFVASIFIVLTLFSGCKDIDSDLTTEIEQEYRRNNANYQLMNRRAHSLARVCYNWTVNKGGKMYIMYPALNKCYIYDYNNEIIAVANIDDK